MYYNQHVVISFKVFFNLGSYGKVLKLHYCDYVCLLFLNIDSYPGSRINVVVSVVCFVCEVMSCQLSCGFAFKTITECFIQETPAPLIAAGVLLNI